MVWDDGGAEHLQEERKAWEFVTVSDFVSFTAPALDLDYDSMSRSRTLKMRIPISQTRVKSHRKRMRTKRHTKAEAHPDRSGGHWATGSPHGNGVGFRWAALLPMGASRCLHIVV